MGESRVTNTDFFVVSTKKLGRLYIFTFGFYGLYWFYKNWKLQQKHELKETVPLLRAIFSIFFVHSLFRRVANSLVLNKISYQFNANLMATWYIILMMVTNVVSSLFDGPPTPPAYSGALMVVMVLLTVYPLQEAQEAVNQLVNDPTGLQNAKYEWWELVIMIIGAVGWFSIVVSPIILSIAAVE